MKKRLAEIDILKGIGIILMVLGHSGFLFSSYIYLFHMALFFIASGFCYSSKNSNDLKNVVNYAWRRMKGLYFPFILASSLCILLSNTFCKLHFLLTDPSYIDTFPGSREGSVYMTSSFSTIIKELIKNLFFAGRIPLFGGSWFILALLGASILFVLLDYLMRRVLKNSLIRHIVMLSITFLLLSIGYIITQRGIVIDVLGFSLEDKIPHVFDALFFFEMGYALKTLFPLVEKKINSKSCIIMAIICFTALAFLNLYGEIEVLSNTITNPIYFMIVSFLGFLGVYAIAFLLKNTLLSAVLQYVGRNTLPILFFHFIAFKLVTYVQIILCNDPIEYLASYPVLYKSWYWVVIYTIVGVFIPLVANALYVKIKSRCKNNITMLK